MRHALLIATLPAVLLAGCVGTRNRGVESVHQPVVSRADYAFDVGAGPGGIAPGERARLAGWMDTLRLRYGDTVAIDDPARAPAVRADVARQAARFGLLLSDDAPVTPVPPAPGTARIIVTRARATVPGCPDFSRVMQPEFESHTSSNYGCSVNANLAAMIADPQDLVRGAPDTPPYDARTGTRAIESYRRGPPTGGGAGGGAAGAR